MGVIRVEVRAPNHLGTWISRLDEKVILLLLLATGLRERRWPALAPQAVATLEAEASEPSSLHRRPGPKPRWQLFIAAKLYDLMEAGKSIPTASELDQLCELEFGYQPGESAINKWLKKLPI